MLRIRSLDTLSLRIDVTHFTTIWSVLVTVKALNIWLRGVSSLLRTIEKGVRLMLDVPLD